MEKERRTIGLLVSVNYDNFSGVKEGLEYLINKTKCSRFAMVAGPDVNTDARERKETFIEVLKEHGIEINEKLYVAKQNKVRTVEKK